MAHENKIFKPADLIYDKIGKDKTIKLFKKMGHTAYEAPEKDSKAHYDVILEILEGDAVELIKVECEVRKEHYDELYTGGYSDVRFPKRKFYNYCDTPDETEDLPDIIITMNHETGDMRFIMSHQEAIRAGLPKKYKAWNRETRKKEWFVPLDKTACIRLYIQDDDVVYDGLVSDG